MDDQSQWKKELSFGRKPKEQTDADESPVTDAKPASPFKKELSFKRTDAADDADVVAAAPASSPTASAFGLRLNESSFFHMDVGFSSVAGDSSASACFLGLRPKDNSFFQSDLSSITNSPRRAGRRRVAARLAAG
jgi:hypothetical protein